MTPDQIALVIKKASQMGFLGFGGMCAGSAIALNRVLFDGEGTLVGAFNEAFLQKQSPIGHVAVEFDGNIWDADYVELADELGINWTDEAAEEVALVAFDHEAELMDLCKGVFADYPMAEQQAILMRACREVLGKTAFPAVEIDMSNITVY